jgi:hypothetical protein
MKIMVGERGFEPPTFWSYHFLPFVLDRLCCLSAQFFALKERITSLSHLAEVFAVPGTAGAGNLVSER